MPPEHPGTPYMAALRRAGLVADPKGEHQEAADSAEYHFDAQGTLSMFAEVLGHLHDLEVPSPIDPLRPPELTLAAVLAQAAAVTSEHPDAPVDRAYGHMSRSELLEVLDHAMQRLGEQDDAAVAITHGGPTLSSLLCSGGSVAGFAHWEAVAVADRHRDLAAATASVGSVFGPGAIPAFLDRYPSQPDLARLEWWLLARQLTTVPSDAVPSDAVPSDAVPTERRLRDVRGG